MRYVIFGDETTLPLMKTVLGNSIVLSIVASNRPQVLEKITGKEFIQPAKNSEEYLQFIDKIRQVDPDIIFCFSYSMILDSTILSIPKLGAINIHGGILPQYRGANILNWVLVEGASETGVTAHYMTDQIDAGDIICQKKVQIEGNDTALTLKHKLDQVSIDLLRNIHADIEAGKNLTCIPQDKALINYYPRRTLEQGKIDWSASDQDIYNLIRALVDPWPGAWYLDKENNKKIIKKILTLEEIRILKEKYSV